MAQWKRIGMDLGLGAVAGVGDQIVSNFDASQDAKSATPIGFGKKIGTYYNYGLPILFTVLAGANVVRGDMASRLVTIGGQLAARKVTQQVTHYTMVKSPSAWSRAGRSASERAAAAAAREAAGYQSVSPTEVLV